ncbi:MAG: hypothetical protein Kow00114_25710 [Kiloniellaceae bacterium]
MRAGIAGVRVCAAAAALCVLSGPAGAGVPASPENGTAKLSVTYELKGAGVDRPASHEKNVTWEVMNRYTVEATLTAQKPGGFPAMHKLDAAGQAREAERAAAANAAAGAMQPMMVQVEQIMKLCGEDEACITRETMKMAQGLDPNSAAMQSAKENIAKVGVMPELRYQIFQPATQTATYLVQESAHEAYFDAACSLATEERCAFDTAVTGEGDITDSAGAPLSPTGAAAEIDYQAGSLILQMTLPGVAKVTKTVTTRNPHVEAGSSEAVRFLNHDAVAKVPVEVSCGDCKTAAGSFEREVPDQLLGRPAKLVVSWTFTRP